MTTPAFETMHPDPIRRVELAMEDMRQGRMVIMIDDEDRENEGDLVVAAEKITPELINFMATHARGLICLTLTAEQVSRLGLPMMASNNQSQYGTAFTVSIEARGGVTTGISAADRAHTVKVAIAPDANTRSVVTPGHMFPLRARDGGVLERVGQTEGSVDLSRLSGLDASAVICEIMNDDGTMSRLPELIRFGERHQLRIVAVADIIKYRMQRERIVVPRETGSLSIPGLGTWNTRLYSGFSGGSHLAVWLGNPSSEPTLVRVQSSPPPWGFLNHQSSGLAQAARASLEAIFREGKGAVVFMHVGASSETALRQAFVKDFGGDLESAPQARAEALRDLGTGCQILRDLGLGRLRLLSSSDRSIVGIEAYGLQILERVPLLVSRTSE